MKMFVHTKSLSRSLNRKPFQAHVHIGCAITYMYYPRSQAHKRNAKVGLVTLGKIPVCAEVSVLISGR